jgi:hypothetical protein
MQWKHEKKMRQKQKRPKRLKTQKVIKTLFGFAEKNAKKGILGHF